MIRANRFDCGGVPVHSTCVSSHYAGLWPDDFLWPMLACPGTYTPAQLTRIAGFLTDSSVDLDCLPDHIFAYGMPAMKPGATPIGDDMPMHLPGAWSRLLDYLEQWGAEIPRKKDWVGVMRRSLDRTPFSCGLAYVDPQLPRVGFGFHDMVAITGFELASSLVLHCGFRRAVRVFADAATPEDLERWDGLSRRVPGNLYRLYDEEQGAFVAGSHDCRQVNVWFNGLAYWMVDEEKQERIVAFLRRNRDRIFACGFTRQIVEPEGWGRLLHETPVGSYINGGHWGVGTGFVLPAIADRDPELAAEIVGDYVEQAVRTGFPEWLSAEGDARGASRFLRSLAMPILGLRCILESRPLTDLF